MTSTRNNNRINGLTTRQTDSGQELQETRSANHSPSTRSTREIPRIQPDHSSSGDQQSLPDSRRLDSIVSRLSSRLTNSGTSPSTLAAATGTMTTPIVGSVTRRPSSRAALKVLQWNVRGMRNNANKQAYVSAMILQDDPDVVLLQETNLPPESTWKLSGYRVFHRSGVRGLLVAVKSSIQAAEITEEVPAGNGVEVQTVELSLSDGPLRVFNIYRNCSGDRQAHLTPGPLLEVAQQQRSIVGGDFNLHNELWGSCMDNRRCHAGELLAQALENSTMVLLNTGEATHKEGGRLDLTMVTADLAPHADWRVDTSMVTDHFAVKVNLSAEKVGPQRRPPRRNFRRANWELYRDLLTTWSQSFVPPPGLDDHEREIINAINAAADIAIPLTAAKTSSKSTWWFTTERVKELRNRVNQHCKLLKRQPTDENRARLREVIAHAERVCREARVEKWLDWCSSFNQTTSLSAMWSKLKIAGGSRNRQPLLPNPRQKAQDLIEDFSQRSATGQLPENAKQALENLRTQRTRTTESAIQSEDSSTDRPFTQGEMKRAMKQSCTAPGSDSITHNMIYEAGTGAQDQLLGLINHSYRIQRLPEAWKSAEILAIPKQGQPGKYRPISLLSCADKLMERMVLNRLKWKLGKPHPNVMGFKAGSGTADAIAALLTKITDQEPPASKYVVFLDLEKAFELANREVITSQLAERGVRGKLLAWILDFLTNRTATVKFQEKHSEMREFDNGTPQGSVLSPRLFNLMMEFLVSQALPEDTTIYSYADDLVLTSNGLNALTKMQRLLNIVNVHLASLGLKVSPLKTKAMAIATPDPLNRLMVDGTPIEWTRSYKYLGIVIDKPLSFKDHVTYIVARIRKRLNLMRAMTSYLTGATAEVLRAFYVACIRSIVDYAATALALADTRITDVLDKLQNVALRLILGAPSWTKVITMREEANLIPMELRTQQLICSLAIRILSSPDDTPVKRQLVTSINEQRRYPANFWPNKVAGIMKLLEPYQSPKINEDRPTIPPRPPWKEPPGVFVVVRPDGGKKNTRQEQLATDAMTRIRSLEEDRDVIYYTDGSVSTTTRKAGAGIIEIRRDDHIETVTETAVRISDGASSMQAELVAIAGALSMAALSHSNQVIIHTDSMSSLQALQQHWPDDNRDLITTVQRKIQRIVDMGGSVLLHWVPSHVGIPMNERADEAALAGSLQRTIALRIAPSRSSLVKDYGRRARMIWRRRVDVQETSSPSVAWYRAATGGKPIAMPRTVSRQGEVAIYRLRLGYRCKWQILNPHRVENECERCGSDTDQPLVHYVAECEASRQLFGTQEDVAQRVPMGATQRILSACKNPVLLSRRLRVNRPPR